MGAMMLRHVYRQPILQNQLGASGRRRVRRCQLNHRPWMEKMATGERWQPQQLLQAHDGELDRQRSGGDAKPIEDEDSSGSFGRVRSNIATIVAFSLPVLLVPLADPIMSLVDTIFLGQFAGTVQLAALSPCTLIFNFAFYSFTALTIATVSIVAEHLRSQREDLAGKALSTSLVIGAIGGACITLVLTTYGSLLLSLTGCDPVLLPVAEKYLRIRAFAAPAAILTSVLQGSFLAQRDSGTPFKVVASSILLSALGDVILLYRFRFGVVGAAWTTLASQCFSASVLMYHACKSRVKPSIVLPSLSEVFALLRYVSTLGVFYVAKTSSYLFLQAAATRLPAATLAAHQINWSLWGLCSFTNAPLEQASLAFLPVATPGREKNELTIALLITGALLGVALSFVAVGIPTLLPFVLTSDSQLWPTMKSVWIQGLSAMLCCGLDVTSTGILLGNRDTVYVAKAMMISLCTLVGFLSAASFLNRGCTIGIVWWGLATFFVSRIVQSFPRVLSEHFT